VNRDRRQIAKAFLVAIAVLATAVLRAGSALHYSTWAMDEHFIVPFAVGFLGGDLNPHWFGYHTLPMYILAVCYHLEYLAFLLSGLAYLGFSVAPNLVLALSCVFCGHLGGATQWVFSTTLLHRHVDPLYRGRVFAAEMMFFTLVMSASSGLTGYLLDLGISPRRLCAGLALGFFVSGLGWWRGARLSR